MIRVCFLFLCLVAVSRQIAISNFEVPKSAKVGEDVELKCELEGRQKPGFVLKWSWKSFEEDSKEQVVYQRIGNELPSINPKFKDVINVKEKDNLELKDIKSSQGGLYKCHIATYDDDVLQLESLFVYSAGSGPLLNITILPDLLDDNDTQDEIIAKCEAFDVTPEPQLTIYGERSGEFDNIFENRTLLEDGLYQVSKSVRLDNVTSDTIYCKMTYLLFDVPDSDSAIFQANVTFSHGVEEATTEDGDVDVATEELPTTAESLPDSGSSTRGSWMLWLLTAALVHLLAL